VSGYQIITCEQRTEQWHEARRGRLTGSAAGDVTAKGRGSEESVKRRDLRMRLALERITGRCLDSGGFQTAAMKRGIELEPEARSMYEAISGRMVSEVGFVASNCGLFGYSPDAVIMGGDRIVHVVELKCPEWAAHWGYIQTGTIGKDYVAQICHGFMVTGCESLDWMSYHPDYPEKLQHVLIPHLRADWQSEIDAYAKAAAMFMAEVEAFARELETRAA